MSDKALDSVTLALVQNRLDHITKQMGWVMTRTARSPIFNHAHDFSCYLTDREGTIVAQADGIPIHTGGGGFAARALIAAFGDTITEEDAYLLSDPYVAGGNHLPEYLDISGVTVQVSQVERNGRSHRDRLEQTSR